MTTLVTIISKDGLVNNMYVTIKIKTINHLFNICIKLKWNTLYKIWDRGLQIPK